ncbi:MAG: O-antigen polymerase [Prevotella sp.]|nr:O-antigen polymerase [Prevotella sp.]
MDIILLTFFGGFIFLCIYFRIGDIMSPWMITCATWLGILFLFQFYGHYLSPVQPQFYTALSLWVGILCVTSLLTYYAFPAVSHSFEAINKDMPLNVGWFNFFYAISLVCTPLYAYQILKTIAMFGTENLMADIRLLAVQDNPDSGILRYVFVINQALFILAMWKFPKISKFKFITIILANLLCAFSIMEKGFLFFLVIVAMFVLYEKRKIRIRSIIISGVVLFFIFFAINVMRSATEEVANSFTVMDFFSMYILSPTVAFGEVHEKLTDQFGSRTFAFFYAVLTKFDIGNYVVEPKLQPFVMVPIPTNIYTVMQPFYEDFGYKGVAFFAAVYGVVTGAIYRFFRNGDVVAKCLYAYIAEILILQFFQENLILGLSVFFQFLLVFIPILQQRGKVVFINHKE